MERDDDLVKVMRAAARVGSNDDRGVLEWRQLLERAAAEISRLRAELDDLRGGTSPDGGQPDIVDVRAR